MNPHCIGPLAEGIAVQKETDVLKRGTFSNRLEELAKCERKMQYCRECDAEVFLEELRSQRAEEK